MDRLGSVSRISGASFAFMAQLLLRQWRSWAQRSAWQSCAAAARSDRQKGQKPGRCQQGTRAPPGFGGGGGWMGGVGGWVGGWVVHVGNRFDDLFVLIGWFWGRSGR